MYKTFISKKGIRYLYDSVSNNIFQMDESSSTMLPADHGETENLRVLGEEFWDSVYGKEFGLEWKSFPIETCEYEDPEILVIELTQQCNFRCEYCVYSGHYKYERTHNNTRMTRSQIDKIVTRYFKGAHVPDYVSLYGGEPLLQFDSIQYLIGEIEKTNHFPEYAMTTNASHLNNPDITKYIIGKKVRLTISFDGLNHDIYRRTINNEETSGSVRKALELIKRLDEEYFRNYISLSITLAPPYNLKANAEFFNNHDLYSQLKLLVNTVNENDSDMFNCVEFEEERKQLSDEYYELAEEYIDMEGWGKPFHKALFADALVRIDNRIMNLQSEGYPPGPCVPGKNRLYITAKGEKYMCERVGNYGFLGTIDDDKKPVEKYYSVLRDFKERVTGGCQKCMYVRVCDACYSLFHEGDHFTDENRICKICEDKRKWFDLIFYIYICKKEKHDF